MSKRRPERVKSRKAHAIPPARYREHVLPFHVLSWELFEELIRRLLDAKGGFYTHVRYGRRGQEQQGLDIFRRLRSYKYHCWQVKNRCPERRDIAEIVKDFLAGKWAKRTTKLILCVREGLDDVRLQDAVEEEARRLRRRRIQFEAIDGRHLTHELRKHPDLIAEFFHPAWVEAVVGKRADNAPTRLDAARAQSLRKKVYAAYDTHFRLVDMSASPRLTAGVRDIRERFVVPDVDARSPFADSPTERYFSVTAASQFAMENNSDSELDDLIQPEHRRSAPDEISQEASERVPLDDWLFTGSKHLLLGGAGFGKSAALRCLALDLLSDPISFPQAAARLSKSIPLLISFALWTRLTASKGRAVWIKEVANEAYSHRVERTDLEALIDYGLRRGRLVLLIDGLDEYVDENAARITLLTINSIVREHGLRVICSGRTAIARKLDIFGADWRIARINEFTRDQQEDVVARITSSTSMADDQRVATARDRDGDGFFQDLGRMSQLHALAANPLLLTCLLSVWSQAGTLPRTRFQLFETLTELMLEVHPRHRTTASGETKQRDSAFSKSPYLRKAALSRLALCMQSAGTAISMLRTDARKIIESFLSDRKLAGWSRKEAQQGAFELIDEDADVSGNFLERTGEEVAFRHAAFREHLAGRELANWPLRKQCAFTAKKADDPRWRTALLVLIQSVHPRAEIEKILKSIRGPRGRTPETVSRRVLLAEAAFTVGANAGTTGAALAMEALNVVEDGLLEAERVELLQLAMSGPREGAIGRAVSDRLHRWWPCVKEYRREAFKVLSTWRPGADLRRTLWISLRDTHFSTRYIAASALATVFSHDGKLSSQLRAQIGRAHDASTAASALYALLLGWPHRRDVKQMWRSARVSDAEELRAVSVLAAYKNGDRTDDVRNALVETIEEGCFDLQDESVDALESGWPNNDLMRNKYWASIDGPRDSANYTFSHALARLIAANPSDERLVMWVQSQFSDGCHPDKRLLECPHVLIQLLKANKAARTAIETWIETHDNQASKALRVGLVPAFRSPKAKELLISDLTNNADGRLGCVEKLLGGWGMKDPETRRALIKVIHAPLSELQQIAPHLPRIMNDERACRDKLIEIARLPKVPYLNRLIDGFKNVGCRPDDTEVVSALWPHVSADTGHSATTSVIRGFHKEPRVRRYALAVLDGRMDFYSDQQCALAAIARVYETDQDVRTKVLARIAPLPPYLRRIIASHAAQRVDDPLLRSLVTPCGVEHDSEANSLATVGLCKAMLAEGSSVAGLRSLLHAEFTSAESPWFARIAAVAGLLTLGDLNTVLTTIGRRERGRRNLSHGVVYLHDSLPTVTGLIARHWTEVESALGKSTIDLLCPGAESALLFWRRFSAHVSRSPALKMFFLRHCEADERIGEPEIATLARLQPRSDLLLNVCCRALAIPRPSGGDPHRRHLAQAEHAHAMASAARVLASDFAGSDQAVRALEQAVDSCGKWRDQGVDIPYIGLAAGWPDHPLVRKRAVVLASLKSLRFTHGGSMWIASQQMNVRDFTARLTFFLNRRHLSGWDFARDALSAILSRLARDNELRAFLLGYTAHFHDEPSTRASVPLLLATSSPLSEHERVTIDSLRRAEFIGRGMPRFGLDATVNRTRPVAQCLADALAGVSP